MTTTMTKFIWPGFELEIQPSGQWLETNIPEPDPDWRFVDANGHGHFYAKGFPTLRWVSLPCTMGHDDECDAEGYWECPLCEERITPGSRQPKPVYLAGPTTYRLTAIEDNRTIRYVFGQGQFDDLQAAVGQAMRDALAGCESEFSIG